MDGATVMFTASVHAMVPVGPMSPDPVPGHLAARLTYHGGRLVQAPKVVQVLYGPGAYLPQLTSATAPNMTSAYGVMVSSGLFDWLSEYDTISPQQEIRRGRFVQSTQIVPATDRGRALVTDADVQTELVAQIRSGVLPAPDGNVIYMINFPAETINVAPDGRLSCHDFCAYHGTFRLGDQNIYYSVLPDLGAGECPTGCGAASAFDSQTAVASHELIDIITDP
jgi:hypothetical protein